MKNPFSRKYASSLNKRTYKNSNKIGMTSVKNKTISYDELSEYTHQKPQVRLLDISDNQFPDATIYNGGLFTLNNNLYLIARVEALDTEKASVRQYKFDNGKFYSDISSSHRNNSQDPSPVYHHQHGIIYSVVETLPNNNDPDLVDNYRSVICSSEDFHNPGTKIYSSGPFGQKGLKVFYNEETKDYLVIVRNRHEIIDKNGKHIISSTHISRVDDITKITPEYTTSIINSPDTAIQGFFAPNEWGNIADCMLQLDDGRIALMGHIAKYGNKIPNSKFEYEKYYSIFGAILDPDTRTLSEVKMLLVAEDVLNTVPDLPPKRLDLKNVVYPRSMGFTIDKNNDSNISLIGSCGVSDRYSIIFRTTWPFSIKPKVDSVANSIFTYDKEKIDKLF